ncbi:MAG TPA: aromatic ring-hydroxylating dioxygenase subunit alpha [Myxococcales bacterium]|nr:aromatic ring-hydroxylating dioxygenase subunit alpha [Myxococcales bacterium]
MQSEIDPELASRLEALLEVQPDASALLQPFYNDAQIFEHDVARIHMQQWLCAGHVSQAPETGDWFRFDMAAEPLIIVRGSDGELRALLNVCRHRGSVVCAEQAGHSNRLICPYHGWTYDLEGRLRSARNMGDLDLGAHSLASIHCRVAGGLIFVCFADEAPDFDHAAGVFERSVGRFGWADAKVAHRASYTVAANWKLVTENYQECYHCRPAHPEFSRFHATAKPDEANVDLRRSASGLAIAQGIEIEEFDNWPFGDAAGSQGIAVSNDAMYAGSVTGSRDGNPLAPLMGDFKDYCGGFFTYVETGPASFFLAYPDHGLVYLFIPRTAQRTDMEVLWLVDSKAEAGTDYSVEELSWLWDVTSIADKRIIERNQEGVNSRYYVPGPYGPMEDRTQAFIAWYLSQIRP